MMSLDETQGRNRWDDPNKSAGKVSEDSTSEA